MSKPKINAHKKKPMTNKRLKQLLDQHYFDSGMMTAFVDPPFTVEEQAAARFAASEVLDQLSKVGSSGRHMALVTILMYQSQVRNVIKYMEGVLKGNA